MLEPSADKQNKFDVLNQLNTMSYIGDYNYSKITRNVVLNAFDYMCYEDSINFENSFRILVMVVLQYRIFNLIH